MRSVILTYILTLALTAFSVTGFADENKKGLTRRGFISSFLAAGAVAATPSSVLSAGSTSGSSTAALPPAILKKLAAIRISSLDTIDSGLNVYIKQLRKILADTRSESLKKLLNARIIKAENALTIYQDVRMAARGEVTTSFENSNTVSNSLSKIDQKETLRLNQKKIRMLQDLDSISPDLKFLIIRSVLDVRLLNRMAWQAHYGSESIILSQSDTALLEKYQLALEKALSMSPPDSMSALMIPKLLTEVDFVLDNTKFSVRTGRESFSCKSLI